MADLINLRNARKARARAASETKAAANRTLYGQTKAERQAARAEKSRQEKALNAAKREQD